MSKPIRVYRDAGYLINVKSLSQENIDDATQMFTYSFYDEGGCNRCELLEQRHCETCDNCPSFMGKRQLAKVVEREGHQLLSLPYGATAKVRAFLKSLDREYVAIDRHPEPTPFSRPIHLLPTIKLKDFQQEALEVILKKRKGLIEAPPRSGKTVIGAAAICAIGSKTLIIASQREWLNQFRETFIGSETAMRFTNAQTRQIAFCKTYEEFEDTDICLATPQQFMNERGKALLQRIKALFTVIVLDEAHLAPALETSRVLAVFNATYRIGLTATPARKQQDLINIIFDLFGPVIYKAEVERLVPRVEVLETGLEFNLGKSGDFTRFVNKMEYSKKRIEMIAKRVCKAVEEGHMVLVPVLRVRAVTLLVKAINEYAEVYLAKPFHGQLHKKVRDATVNDARTYKTKVLVGNVRLLSTGLNIPRASCLLESALSSNIPNAEQRTARILTPYEDKPDPLIIYVLDNSDVMRSTRRKEWWNCVQPKFKPRMSKATRDHLMNWFANKATDKSYQGGRDAFQL